MILLNIGDTLKGERIVCEFRRMKGPYLIIGTSAHRAQRIVVEGLPAVAIIEKPIRLPK